MNTSLTHLHETHATVWYTVGDNDKVFEGWLTLNGNRVVARKLRGRNRFHLTNINNIVSVSEVK